MYCAHLSLTNFRNYVRLELDLAPEVTVIVGDNAQGKSNLLEALYLMATTKSFRASSDRELIAWTVAGTELSFTRLVARVQRTQSQPKLELVIREETRAGPNGAPMPVGKRLKLNDVPRRAIDVLGTANVVMFTPQDVDLVQGSPSVRRRYLDVTLSQVDARYCRSLAHYNRVLEQRNHLLRQIRDHRARVEQLHFWDQELTQAGAYVVAGRLQTIAALSDLAHGYHRRLTGREERLRVDYRSTLNGATAGRSNGGSSNATGSLDIQSQSISQIATHFAELIRRQRDREVAAGMSLYGPHRDDLTFLVDDRDMNVFGSRGQQRTIALALKLAEADYLASQTGELPILLLDDVMSELDERRRAHVFETIAPGQQVILTTTDLDAIDPAFLARAAVLRVERGAITPVRASASTGGVLRDRSEEGCG